jgi:hypothetical protein
MAADWEIWRDAFVDQIREQTMMEALKQAALAENMLTYTSNLTTAVVRSRKARQENENRMNLTAITPLEITLRVLRLCERFCGAA